MRVECVPFLGFDFKKRWPTRISKINLNGRVVV
jgi:hypothetical protein